MYKAHYSQVPDEMYFLLLLQGFKDMAFGNSLIRFKILVRQWVLFVTRVYLFGSCFIQRCSFHTMINKQKPEYNSNPMAFFFFFLILKTERIRFMESGHIETYLEAPFLFA